MLQRDLQLAKSLLELQGGGELDSDRARGGVQSRCGSGVSQVSGLAVIEGH